MPVIPAPSQPIVEQPESVLTRRRLLFWFPVVSGALVTIAAAIGVVRYVRTPAADRPRTLQELSVDLFGNGAGPGVTPVATATVPRLLDGAPVATEAANPPLIAVMIDNHGDARPPAGLTRAGLVYEAEAEGGITRYMAVITADAGIERLGPVRSARPYFIDWAREFGALYVHVGGSPDALAKLAQPGTPDLNEFFNAPAFWRDDRRFAPHNVLTSSDLLNTYLAKKPLPAAVFLPWRFKEEPPVDTRPTALTVTIPYYNPNYYVVWRYDRTNNEFVRYLGGLIHQDESGTALTAKNVLIAAMTHTVLDEKLRIDLDNIGDGDAIVCLDGACRPGTWRKPAAAGRTRFFVNEEEVALNPGVTWIEAVRPELEVTYE